MRRTSRVLNPIVVWALFVPAVAAAEGTQSGVVSGMVTDATAAPLAGVQVELSGGQGSRSVLTEEQGRFRFPAVPVGRYELEARLFGLSATATEVVVYLGRTTEASLRLAPATPSGEGDEVPAADEEEPPVARARDWLRVYAEAPIVDRFDTRVGANVSSDFLDALPVPRFYQSVSLLLPGMAGGEDGNPNVSGALRSANLFLVDGVDTTDPTTGLFGLNLAFEATREVRVTTASPPVTYGRGSGAIVDVVTRSGGNEIEGLARWIATDRSWDADYDYDDEAFQHLGKEIRTANEDEGRRDSFAGYLGGPLVRDRLWYFLAYQDEARSFLRPVRIGLRRWDEDVEVSAAVAKLDIQPSGADSVVVEYAGDAAEFSAFRPFDRGPGENRASLEPGPLGQSFVGRLPGDVFAVQRLSQDGSLAELQWNRVIGPRWTVSASAAVQDRRLERDPLGRRGLTADSPHVAVIRFDPRPDDEVQIREVALFNGITDLGSEERSRRQAGARADWLVTLGAMDHDLALGLEYHQTTSQQDLRVPGLAGVDRATGRPVSGQMFLDLDRDEDCGVTESCLPFDPASGEFSPFVLFNFWRADPTETEQESWALYLADQLTVGRWFLEAGVRVEAVEATDSAGRTLVEDTTVAPRLAAKVDLGGDGELLLGASWSRFYEPFLHGYLDSFSRLELFSGFTEYGWAGAAGFDCRDQDPADPASPCWVPRGGRPFFTVRAADPNPELARTYVDELTLGIERQVSPRLGVSLHYVQREWHDLWDEALTLVDEPGAPRRAIAEIRNLPEAEREYRGLHFLVQRRLTGRWQLLGSYTWSETEGNIFRADGFSPLGDFPSLRLGENLYGLAPYDRKHQLGAFGLYQVSWGRVAVTLGAGLRYQSGLVYQAQVEDDFGTVFLEPRGSRRLPDTLQIDASLGTDVDLGRDVALRVELEAFNLSDEQEQLGADGDVDRLGQARSIADLQAPRSLRLTAGVRF
jgi:hypothetical protein